MTRQDAFSIPSDPDQSPRILDGAVYAIVEAGDKIIVGGSFTSVRDYNATVSVTRNRIFAFSKTTGLIDPAFAPSMDREVNTLVASPDGAWVYAGGAFNTISGVGRNKLVKLSVAAAFDPTTGAVLGFDVPVAESRDTELPNVVELDTSPDGRWLAVVGNFITVGGQRREQLALIDLTTQAVADWSTTRFNRTAAPRSPGRTSTTSPSRPTAPSS